MGSSLKPSPPAAPNATQVSTQQTANDIGVATANSWLQNANETGPNGSVQYNQTGTQTVRVPTIGAGGTTVFQNYDVPTFSRNVTLSPAEQQKLDQQNQLGSSLNNLAISQTNKVSNILGNPVDAGSLPARQNSYGANPTLQNVGAGPSLNRVGTTFADTGTARTALPNSDYGAQRSAVENAIYSRINPQLDRDRASLETKLVNQGLVRGTDAFNTAMDESNRQANDARMQAVLAGGQEQSRLAGLDLSAGNFYNSGQAQNFSQANQRGMFGLQATDQNNQAAQQEYGNQQTATNQNNQVAQQQFGNTQASVQFQNENRDKALQETLALRNQPINEITSLMGGGQVSLPQFQQYNPGTVAPNQFAANTYNSAAIANQNYQTQQSGTNALLGALGGLGGAGLYGLAKR